MEEIEIEKFSCTVLKLTIPLMLPIQEVKITIAYQYWKVSD